MVVAAWKLVSERVIVTAFRNAEISMLADDASHEESPSDEDDVTSTSGAVLKSTTAAMVDEALLSLFVSDL